MKKIFSLFAAVLFAGSMLAADLYSYDFKANGQGEWTINNVTLPDGISYVWNYDNRYGMKASAYVSGTNYETESWLVSPVLNLSEAESATLAFTHARKYGNLDQLSVRAKAGEGDWLTLEVSAWPDGSSWDFVNATADMADFAGEAEVQVAFVYTSSTTAGATWEIGTVAISTEGGDIEPEVTPAVPEGSPSSEARSDPLAILYEKTLCLASRFSFFMLSKLNKASSSLPTGKICAINFDFFSTISATL